jgi:hypothetical protein
MVIQQCAWVVTLTTSRQRFQMPVGTSGHGANAVSFWIRSTSFALLVCMEHVTYSVRSVADAVGRALGRVTAVIIGFVMMVVGLAMTVSIVLLPFGVVVGLLGVGLFLAGLFAHVDQKT